MTADDDPTIIPMKEVRPKPIGIVISWGNNASEGLLAKRAKSGSLTIRVAKFETADMMPAMTPHASFDPPTVAG